MTRWRAAGLHLLISVGVAALALALMLGLMYPIEYFRASGGQKLLLILVFVDVVIGPLLTLIVFKSGKPSLRFDLAVIGLLQLAALLYGLWVVVQARPAFIVHVGDRFHLVRANELAPEQLATGAEERFQTLSYLGPRLTVALRPLNLQRQQELMMAAMSGADLQYFPETYADYEANAYVVLARAQDAAALLARRPDDTVAVTKYLEREQIAVDAVAVVPLKVGDNFLTALVDAETAELLRVFPIDPWD
ncbi:MAG: TfpX/TfpZ family type IV pilin accessory protein [Pseudomonadota bacterium]